MMDNSIEKQSRKALNRMVFWRLMGDLWQIPQAFVVAIGTLFQGIHGWLKNVEMTLFYYELDAARRYKLLTGIDMAASGFAPARYAALLNQDLTEEQQRDFLKDYMAGAAEDDE